MNLKVGRIMCTGELVFVLYSSKLGGYFFGIIDSGLFKFELEGEDWLVRDLKGNMVPTSCT